MNLKLFIIIILVLVLFVNSFLSCNKIEKFIDGTVDERQDDAISNTIPRLNQLEKEYNETNNKLEPIRTQITDLDSTITKIDDKIKANLSLELTEKNSNRVREENIRLEKDKKELIRRKNNLIKDRNSLIGTNRRLNHEIGKRKVYNRSLSHQTNVLLAQYRGLKDPGRVVFSNYRDRPIYQLKTNDKSRETNGNSSVLRHARYCYISPGHRVILFNNYDWSCKPGQRYIVISGGRSGIRVNLNKYIAYSYNQTYNERVFKNKRVRVRVGWKRRWRWRKRWVDEKRTKRIDVRWNEITRSVRLERIINNDYRKGKVDIRLDNTTCRTPS
tara:strand:+ start:5335 stop:6321 length:987 start_codon:yes stop_codon:yes gene_type:complete